MTALKSEDSLKKWASIHNLFRLRKMKGNKKENFLNNSAPIVSAISPLGVFQAP
jgi:hypothetical protein